MPPILLHSLPETVQAELVTVSAKATMRSPHGRSLLKDRARGLASLMLTLYAFRTMTHLGLGEFEQLVLLAIIHLGGEAYGIPIVDEIERRTGRAVARAAVYVT